MMRRFIAIAVLSIPLLAGCTAGQGSDPSPSALLPATPQPTSTTNQDAPSLEGVHEMTPEDKPEYVPPTISGDISKPEDVCTGITELNMDDLNMAIAIHLKLSDGMEPLTDAQKTQVDEYRTKAFEEACPEYLEQPQEQTVPMQP